MPKQIKVFVVFCIVSILITGCTPVSSKKHLSKEIDDLLVQHKYEMALTELDSIKDSNSKYETLRKQVLEEANDYASKRIATSRHLVEQNHIYRAFKTLEDALQNFHQSTALKNELALLADKREALIQQTLDGLLLIYAQYLDKALDTHQQIARWEFGSERLSQKYMDLHLEANNLAKHLIEIGKAKQKQGKDHVPAATEYFRIALRLSDAESVAAVNREIDKNKTIMAQLRTKQAKTKQSQVQKKAEQLKKQIGRVKDRIGQKDFVSAKRMINDTKYFPVNDQSTKELKALYQAALDKEINKSFQQGVKYYSTEKYQLALQSWKQTLKLDPKHEKARKNVNRVSHILAKIKQLRQKDK